MYLCYLPDGKDKRLFIVVSVLIVEVPSLNIVKFLEISLTPLAVIH